MFKNHHDELEKAGKSAFLIGSDQVARSATRSGPGSRPLPCLSWFCDLDKTKQTHQEDGSQQTEHIQIPARWF